jgi:hypothetical protein
VNLYDYQQKVVAEYEAKIAAGIRRPLIAAATGSGKTVIASEIVRREVARSKRVVFLAHRDELLHDGTLSSDRCRRLRQRTGSLQYAQPISGHRITAELSSTGLRTSVAAYEESWRASLTEAATRFAISQPAIGTILVGIAAPHQFENALAAVEKGPLPRAALDRLSTLLQTFSGEPR